MPLWLADQPLVLASKSAIRGDVLRAAGLAIEVCPADIDERTIEQGSTARDPGEIAALLAREKALAVAARLPGRVVLGADQTLALGERRFSKPTDLVRDGVILFEHREAARLTMRAFSDRFLEHYLDAAGAAVTASVGGYQLEKTGIQLFERVDGDHFVILVLPLLPLLLHLRQAGWLAA